MKMKTAINAIYWLVALIWVSVTGYFIWSVVEKIQQQADTSASPLQMTAVTAVGLICIFQAPAVASRVTCWIESVAAPEQQ